MPVNLSAFRAPYIPREQVEAEADEFRRKFAPGDQLPIDIEAIIEFDLNMQIRAFPNLRSTCDIDALLLGDLKTIAVDRDIYMDDRMTNRLRFSLAHEIGHKVLHPDLYGKISHNSIEEWIQSFQSIPDDQYSRVEQQAYAFAGRLLVPVLRLKQDMAQAVTHATSAGFTAWDQSGDAAREYIANSLCKTFGVSGQVIEKRLIREKLWPPE